MKQETIDIQGIRIPVYSVNTLVIGSGAASLNAAVQLFKKGQTNIAMATEEWGGGTSNNSGSDKQTYYKLSLSGDISDSPFEMAKDLYNGGSMHGDIALCEAQNSAPSFFHLVRLGVPFPHDAFGAYVGYKTDHDPRGRGTSAGPLTSHLMFKCLAEDVQKKGIKIFDGHEVIALLTKGKGKNKCAAGALAIDKKNLDSPGFGMVVFNAVNTILGTGGPAGIYKTSVYPESQTGSIGLAFEVGAVGHNLTESQFGLASTRFRWNLSGTYQQVIPRYLSTDRNGGDEQEFLNPHFPDMGSLATAIFLKGYQWPFDPRKILDHGSSLIDLLVYRETFEKGRKVLLDYTRNPSGAGILEEFSLELLSDEAYSYLNNSQALLDSPIKRLKKMNPPAFDLYKQQGIDLSEEYLEIAVCAQHNNGGLKGNIWWESNIKHLFPVGEVNGTHGVYRPGGSALNAGQVGGMRAAFYISKRYGQDPLDLDSFRSQVQDQIGIKIEWIQKILREEKAEPRAEQSSRDEIRKRMTAQGACIRDPQKIDEALEQAWELYSALKQNTRIFSVKDITSAFKDLDLCLVHALYLEAIKEYIEKKGQSRGSYLILDPEEDPPSEALGRKWAFRLYSKESFVEKHILEIFLAEDQKVGKKWVPIRPLPQEDLWFENVWIDYLNDNIIKEVDDD
jgi:succinate dehydrogenase/fumarate reductase flavoprotein subunit